MNKPCTTRSTERKLKKRTKICSTNSPLSFHSGLSMHIKKVKNQCEPHPNRHICHNIFTQAFLELVLY